MITKREVSTFKIDFLCPVCHKGYMRPTGVVIGVHPSTFVHKCNNKEIECNHMENILDKTYPYVEYEPKL